MSNPRYLPLSLPDIVENALGIRFSVADLLRFSPSPAEVQRLASDLQHYYDNFAWKQKKDAELRPYISPSYLPGASLGARFVSGGGTDKGYVYDPSVEGEIRRSVKKYLLYCHSLCIHDRLPYLLDYFQSNPENQYARARMPGIRALLIEYAGLAELLRTGTLIPISDEVFGKTILANDTWAVHTEALKKVLPGIPEDQLRLMEEMIHRHEIQVERTGREIDLFFPTKDYVDVLRALLVAAERKLTSSQLAEPFRVGVLESIPVANPEAITEEDIIRMRDEDELFEEWRSTLRRILERVHNSQASDLEHETIEVARDEIRAWKNSLEEKAKKSSILRSWQDGLVKATIGFATGAATGRDLHSGLVGAGLTGAMWLIWGGLQGARDRSRLQLARQHFLAIGLTDSGDSG